MMLLSGVSWAVAWEMMFLTNAWNLWNDSVVTERKMTISELPASLTSTNLLIARDLVDWSWAAIFVEVSELHSEAAVCWISLVSPAIVVVDVVDVDFWMIVV